MKKAAVILTLLILFCSLASASRTFQRSGRAPDSHLWAIAKVKGLDMEGGYPEFSRARRLTSMSRSDIASFARAVLEFSYKILVSTDDPRFATWVSQESVRSAIAEDFWNLEFLMRMYSLEMVETGLEYPQMWSDLASVKNALIARGVELYDPFGDKFSDVPEEHWAGEAIHNMRRAGILFGYPDGKFFSGDSR